MTRYSFRIALLSLALVAGFAAQSMTKPGILEGAETAHFLMFKIC